MSDKPERMVLQLNDGTQFMAMVSMDPAGLKIASPGLFGFTAVANRESARQVCLRILELLETK